MPRAAAAAAVRDAIAAAERGKAGLDDVPSHADVEDLAATMHLLRAAGSGTELPPQRSAAVWDRIESNLRSQDARAKSRRKQRRRFAWVAASLGTLAAAAALLLVFAKTVPETDDFTPPESPNAVSTFDRDNTADYAAKLMRSKPQDQDRVMSEYRRQRSDAYRQDATHRARYYAAGGSP